MELLEIVLDVAPDDACSLGTGVAGMVAANGNLVGMVSDSSDTYSPVTPCSDVSRMCHAKARPAVFRVLLLLDKSVNNSATL